MTVRLQKDAEALIRGIVNCYNNQVDRFADDSESIAKELREFIKTEASFRNIPMALLRDLNYLIDFSKTFPFSEDLWAQVFNDSAMLESTDKKNKKLKESESTDSANKYLNSISNIGANQGAFDAALNAYVAGTLGITDEAELDISTTDDAILDDAATYVASMDFDNTGYEDAILEAYYAGVREHAESASENKWGFEIVEYDDIGRPHLLLDGWGHEFVVDGLASAYNNRAEWEEDVLEALDDPEFVEYDPNYLDDLFNYQDSLAKSFYGHGLIAPSV